MGHALPCCGQGYDPMAQLGGRGGLGFRFGPCFYQDMEHLEVDVMLRETQLSVLRSVSFLSRKDACSAPNF